MLAKIVDALKALAMVYHQLAYQPEIIEGQGRILASAVFFMPCVFFADGMI